MGRRKQGGRERERKREERYREIERERKEKERERERYRERESNSLNVHMITRKMSTLHRRKETPLPIFSCALSCSTAENNTYKHKLTE
jgi:uridine kinase